jgi:hypothetical protein
VDRASTGSNCSTGTNMRPSRRSNRRGTSWIRTTVPRTATSSLVSRHLADHAERGLHPAFPCLDQLPVNIATSDIDVEMNVAEDSVDARRPLDRQTPKLLKKADDRTPDPESMSAEDLYRRARVNSAARVPTGPSQLSFGRRLDASVFHRPTAWAREPGTLPDAALA